MPVPPLLRLNGITKRFGTLLANDGISLDLARGEVLALLGENGAGKSTLVSILFGHYVADAGTIEVDGQSLPPGQPKAALAAGIGMVHQHFTLADNLTVLDNVMLGTESLWQPRSRRREARAALLDAARRFGLAVDPDARIGTLSVGERQRVEILKALVSFGRKQGARILILDEPTAVLTPQESESLFATLAQMVAAGLAIVFISHKLDEVLRVSDRIAVLRAGRLVGVLPADGADKAMLAEAMVGRRVAPAVKHDRTRGPVVAALRGATVRGTGPRPMLDGVDLAVHAGEVLAVAGVAGNGQQTLAELLCGELALDAGTLQVNGQALPARPRAWVQAGVARIPEDRHAVGVVGDLPLWENAMLERYAEPPFSQHGRIDRGQARAHAQAVLKRFDVRGAESAGVDTTTRSLSGGNMQKLILGRALTEAAGTAGRSTPRLIVANQPTWGLDIGAVAYVHQQLLDACAAGAALLLISEDLDEIFALADRIAVLHLGRLGPARPRAGWTLAAIGLAMAGAEEAHDAA
jgi:general nucleoside transport system ATP-binding protein